MQTRGNMLSSVYVKTVSRNREARIVLRQVENTETQNLKRHTYRISGSYQIRCCCLNKQSLNIY